MINRTAVLVRPKAAFFALVSTEGRLVRQTSIHNSVYLLPTADSEYELETLLEKAADAILANEAIAARSLEAFDFPIGLPRFKELFDYEYHHLVIDLTHEPVAYEQYSVAKL